MLGSEVAEPSDTIVNVRVVQKGKPDRLLQCPGENTSFYCCDKCSGKCSNCSLLLLQLVVTAAFSTAFDMARIATAALHTVIDVVLLRLKLHLLLVVATDGCGHFITKNNHFTVVLCIAT